MTQPMISRICWCDYSVMIHDLAQQVKRFKRGKPKQIVALGRGGFVPGVQLSHLLDIPVVPLMWQTRDGHINEKYVTDKHTLIVDDINDSGRTLMDVCTKNIWDGSYSVAVLLHKYTSEFTAVDYYAEIADNDKWYVFPWEKR